MVNVAAVFADWFDAQSHRRVLALVVLGALLLYLPFAGSYGLWDPWETHYGEVARQMTVRGDYISLWWPGSPRDQDAFWSKPVLTFWIFSLFMHVFRVGLPGGDPGELALGFRSEWALRMPGILMAVLAVASVCVLVARLHSRRAGVLAAIVLATSPMFSLIARQAMTDMVFVGPMTLALCLGGLVLSDDDDTELARRRFWRLSWPHHGLFYAMLAVFVFAVLVPLAVFSVQLRVALPWGGRIRVMYGVVVMLPYIAGALVFLFFAARTRRRAPLYLYVAALMCGLAVLAKGLAGLGLPVIVFLSFVACTWRWDRLTRPGMVPALLLAVLVVVLVMVPWHHTMIIRHGWAFWDELFGDNHWRRMVLGRHGDRGTFEYFLRELGFGVWPWLAVLPAALARVLMPAVPDVGQAAPARPRISVGHYGVIWFVSSYAVVSLSMTKFHHYLAPALPGLAIAIGCGLDRLAHTAAARAHGPATAPLAVLAGVPLTLLVLENLTRSPRAAERFLWLFNYDYVHSPTGRPWPESLDFVVPLMLFGALFVLATTAFVVGRLRRAAYVGLPVVAIAFTYFLLDYYMPRVTPYWSQKHPIAEYYRQRKSPDEKLVAYMMYWRGETYYTKNAIYEGPREERTVFDTDRADEDLRAWVERNRGRRAFFLFERGRQARLVSLLPADSRATFTILHQENNKFSLGRADL